MKNYHRKWYAGETISVGIGQGAIQATPLQLARIIGGIASGGHMVRPRVVAPDQLPPDFRKYVDETYSGSGTKYIPIDPANWEIITEGMAETTQQGLYHTAESAHLDGIDLAGKTGTAQVMSHDALAKTNKGRYTYPNVWFVGVVPRRNPELVVAVLWQNGEFSYYPARIGAKVVAAYVEKQRRLMHNLQAEKPAPPPKPVEVGAIWTQPAVDASGKTTARLKGGRFYVNPPAEPTESAALRNTPRPRQRTPVQPAQLGALVPWKKP